MYVPLPFPSSSPQFFKLDVLYEAPNGELSAAPASHILEQLRAIMKTATDPAPYPVGILTSEHRDTWAGARERLVAGKRGRKGGREGGREGGRGEGRGRRGVGREEQRECEREGGG